MAKNQRDFRQFPVERLGVLWPSHVASSPQAFGWGESKSRSSCGVPGLNMPQPMSKILEMCWKCVGNVSTEIDLSLMEGAWNAMVCVWMCACILCINKVPEVSNLNGVTSVTYGDIWWLWGSQFTERSEHGWALRNPPRPSQILAIWYH